MTHVVVRHDNKGLGAAWHLEQVEVVQPFSRKTLFFPCNDWLQKSKETGLDGCQRVLHAGATGEDGMRQFKVAVHTSDIRGAGTDSNIKLVLMGDVGQSEPLKLDTSANNFERGMVREQEGLPSAYSPCIPGCARISLCCPVPLSPYHDCPVKGRLGNSFSPHGDTPLISLGWGGGGWGWGLGGGAGRGRGGCVSPPSRYCA